MSAARRKHLQQAKDMQMEYYGWNRKYIPQENAAKQYGQGLLLEPRWQECTHPFELGPNGFGTYTDQACVGPISKWDLLRNSMEPGSDGFGTYIGQGCVGSISKWDLLRNSMKSGPTDLGPTSARAA